MRIAATADLHYSAQTLGILKEQFGRVRDEADVLVVAGDLTNFGRPEEMEPLLSVLVRLRIPTIAVLGNHDYECGRRSRLRRDQGLYWRLRAWCPDCLWGARD